VGCGKEGGETLRLQSLIDPLKPGHNLVKIPTNTDGFFISATSGRLTMLVSDAHKTTTNAFGASNLFQEGHMTAQFERVGNKEEITVKGPTTKPFQIQVFNAPGQTGEIQITYRYGAHSPCATPLSGCALCTDYQKCEAGTQALCDGTNVRCSTRPKPTRTDAPTANPSGETAKTPAPPPANAPPPPPAADDKDKKELMAARNKADQAARKEAKEAHDKEMTAANKRVDTVNTNAKEYVKVADDHLKAEIKIKDER
jgi:hypothetical protein